MPYREHVQSKTWVRTINTPNGLFLENKPNDVFLCKLKVDRIQIAQLSTETVWKRESKA